MKGFSSIYLLCWDSAAYKGHSYFSPFMLSIYDYKLQVYLHYYDVVTSTSSASLCRLSSSHRNVISLELNGTYSGIKCIVFKGIFAYYVYF